jgi:dual specificity tyrosine-phosphorylation-regulated kinase 2/3/4
VRVTDFCEVSYVFDMWALASVLLEVLSGFPLWLSLKSRVLSVDGRSIINYGMFGVSARDNAKILTKQQLIMKGGLGSTLQILLKGFDL